MPDIMKRTALTQEVVRIRRNTHPDLPWSYTVRHLDKFSDRMQMSGNSQDFRFQVIKSGIDGYDKTKGLDLEGGRPVNRPRSWEENKRQCRKEIEKKNWFRKGGTMYPCLYLTHQEGNL